ncbi:MAG: hypothetical protein C4539_07200, partial [Ignavibacteriales bacterium]
LLKTFEKFLVFLAPISAIFLILNIILIPFGWQDVFISKKNISGIEIFCIIGFVIVSLFYILLIVYMLLKKFSIESLSSKEKCLLGGGILCFLFMIIIKVLADEIGRESQAGLSVTGEYIIFNILLFIQLLYLITFFKVVRKSNLQVEER